MFADEERDAPPEQADHGGRPDERETVAEAAPVQPVSFGQWLRELISGPVAQRLDDLNEAIARNPQAAANYLLRGEIWLEKGEYEMAAADFEWARALAAEQFEENEWGLVSQTLRDQAEHGLQRAMRKLAHHR